MITQLIKEFVQAREALQAHGIGDTGGYAELLVATALGATRNINGVEKGFDVVCAKRGRIEVRSRTLPGCGRHETRLEIPEAKVGYFDYFAGVLFATNMDVIGGFLLTHDDAITLSGKQKYRRIPYEIGAAHPDAANITSILKQTQAIL